jgi:hypothetical protein
MLDDFEGFDPVAEVTDNVEMAQQLELEVEAEDVAELLESHEVLFILVYFCLYSFPRILK